MKRSIIDKLIAFCIPLPIFVDPTSPILLAQSKLAEGAVAFPISLFLLPLSFMLLFMTKSQRNISKLSYIILILISLFVIYFLFLGVVSSFENKSALIYAIQWVIPFLWIPYFYNLVHSKNTSLFMRFFEKGAILSVLYIFLSSFLEILTYGALQDMGRVTQNLILKGQYQLYVYTPTIIAYSILMCNFIYASGVMKRNILFIVTFNLVAFLSLFSLGAREAIVVYILGIAFFLLSYRTKYILTYFSFVLMISLAITLNAEYIINHFNLEDFRLLNKFQNMTSEGQAFGARDVMILKYFEILTIDPMFAMRALPPELSFPELGVHAPSAHNYYVDVWAWGGGVSAILMYLYLSILFVLSICVIFKIMKRGGVSYMENDEVIIFASAYLIISFLLISNNINVPLRQPLTGAFFSLISIFIIFRGRVSFVEE
ncbi:hypothetical protein P3485_11440 [Vibrio parahaemolyticus]|uniref:hypothetical protein n=1 Tax=Vibrio parahaemolyticus TaxID=670 RepID=UPI00235E592A|nr:hypothetical protein [Vibrio parahaemolyticus]EJB0369698.1 hypothetical protein [Vibrio parahaemolyticus]MDF4516033.1 hypothetical protein [Vibrio parahaemolyticus]MDF4520396.1 hypothetical protein [Vibrio parahaemolyticus]MDF4538876.1 hypothetical protein [Vibrio parahaemolyticus]MDF4547567.1 hypothetical protein [Vibrio parahaemolyticus]